MPKFSPGDKVYYVPDHADGSGHKDAEVGVVTEGPIENYLGGKTSYKVDYNDGSPNAKLTYERHLEPREE